MLGGPLNSPNANPDLSNLGLTNYRIDNSIEGGNEPEGIEFSSDYYNSDPQNIVNFRNGTEQQRNDVLNAIYNIIGSDWFTGETVDVYFEDGYNIAQEMQSQTTNFATGLFVHPNNSKDGPNVPTICLANELWTNPNSEDLAYFVATNYRQFYQVWDAFAHEYAHYATLDLQNGQYWFDENLSIRLVNQIRSKKGLRTRMLWRRIGLWWQISRIREPYGYPNGD
jgi:hypothetical protein